MTVSDAVNRGFNMMVCAVLGLAGLAFGSVIAAESDLPDKIDDAGLLLTGAIALGWYLMGRNRYTRSRVPFILIGLAMLAQLAGVILEASDKEAFGDNIGGSILLVALLILAVVQWNRNGKHLAATS